MSPELPAYAELQCATSFSFLRGASQPEELVARAAALGYAALAITDECSLAGVVRAHGAAQQHGLQLLIGSCFLLQGEAGEPALTLLALAQDRAGYGNLCQLITLARSRAGKGAYLLRSDDLAAPAAPYAHLRGLPGCLLILVPDYDGESARLHQQAAWMAATFGARAHLALSLLHRGRDERHRAEVEQAAARHGLPLVATGDVLMHVRSRKPLQDTLTAIRLGRPLAACGHALAPNAEQHLRSRERLARLYPAAALEQTLRLASACHFSLDQLRYEYPQEAVPAGASPASHLRSETWSGARRRFPAGIPAAVQAQIEHELSLIAELGYEPYFLTVYDIVCFARSRGILCQGRGSAANSAICYCLGITEVDPARASLLFERFISRERREPPDIDVDFEHQRREEVIQYIYRKYGRNRAALTAVVSSYRPRSAMRDVGRALGVDSSLLERVGRALSGWEEGGDLGACLAEAGLAPDTPLARHWQQLARQLLGFPRHLSQHPGGFVLARGLLSRLVPIENAAMPERSVVQWDKDDLDALGLLKVDVLGLGMMSAIRRALALVGQRRGTPFGLADIPSEDPATYRMIGRADTVGVFQIESRAQMSMLPRLAPRSFYDLVIEVAIVRPGPIQGGMVHPYLRRRLGQEPVSYPSPEVEQALARTLGVPIFQEQVMQLAMLAAGFSAGEADQLRRAMAAWRRKGNLEQFGQRLLQGMRERGYTEEYAAALLRQIHGFAEYGFPESHAASFALLAYASAWLKCHEPAAFLAALLNSQPMGFYGPAQLVQDARRHGVEVRPVDVTASAWDAGLEIGLEGKAAVRLGLNQVAGLGREAGRRIEEARGIRPFADLRDLALRASLERADLQALAAADALRALAGNRRQACWAVAAVPERGLLRPATPAEEMPGLPPPGEGESIVADYRSLGLSLGRHPLSLLRPMLAARRFRTARELDTFSDRQLARGCGLVTARQRPPTANGTVFVTLEDETGVVNVIVWPDLAQRQRHELRGASLLGVYGIWQRSGQVCHLVAKRLVDLSPYLGRLAIGSRDFR